MIAFNPDFNFWELNPELKYAEKLKSLYDSDKSKKKEDSSKIMNAIYMLVHKDSRYADLPERERKILIATDYLKDSSFQWTLYEIEINFIIDLTTSKARKLLRNWELKLEERSNFIASLRYDADTFKMLDDMMSASKKIWDEYIKILNEVDKEEAGGSVQGGAVESLSESGRI